MMPLLNTLRLAMYPDEWAWLMTISHQDKAKARAIAKTFWTGLMQDPHKDDRLQVTADAWRNFDAA